jgi:hypothetical protein
MEYLCATIVIATGLAIYTYMYGDQIFEIKLNANNIYMLTDDNLLFRDSNGMFKLLKFAPKLYILLKHMRDTNAVCILSYLKTGDRTGTIVSISKVF